MTLPKTRHCCKSNSYRVYMCIYDYACISAKCCFFFRMCLVTVGTSNRNWVHSWWALGRSPEGRWQQSNKWIQLLCLQEYHINITNTYLSMLYNPRCPIDTWKLPIGTVKHHFFRIFFRSFPSNRPSSQMSGFSCWCADSTSIMRLPSILGVKPAMTLMVQQFLPMGWNISFN